MWDNLVIHSVGVLQASLVFVGGGVLLWAALRLRGKRTHYKAVRRYE